MLASSKYLNVNKINKIENLIENKEINELKIILANETTRILHGEKKSLKAEKLLGESGRIFLRLSGTEKKIRIMGECKKKQLLDKTMSKLKKSISKFVNKHENN